MRTLLARRQREASVDESEANDDGAAVPELGYIAVDDKHQGALHPRDGDNGHDRELDWVAIEELRYHFREELQALISKAIR